MKIFWKTGIIFWIFLLMTTIYANAKPLTIVTEKEWPPYAYEENGEVKGYAIEVLSKIFEKMGVDFTVKAYPWAKSENLALTGKADAVFCASHKTKRAAACYYPPEQLFDSTYVFFIEKANENQLKYTSFEDLKGHKIGITRAYSYTEDFLKFIKDNKNSSQANSDRLNLRKLANGKIDYFPGELGNVTMLLKQENLAEKIVSLPKPFIQKPYYIIFNKKNVDQAFVDQFSAALKEFKTSQDFQAIYGSYFGK